MKSTLTTILFLFITLVTEAHEEFSFRILDVKSGLADNYIRSITSDKYGFMWFSTINGLSRYDGYQFKNYTTTQLGTYNNDIDFTAEDATGTIWIKTPKNYFYYNRERDEIDPDIATILAPLGITGEINNLFIDQDKNLWCVTGHTLFYYKFMQKELFTLEIPPNIQVLQLECYHSNAYILLSDSHMYNIDWRTGYLTQETRISIPPGWTQRMYMDSSHRIWFYVIHTRGLRCYDTKTKQWVIYPGYEEINSNLITGVIDDNNGHIWVGTDNQGIYLINDTDKTYDRVCRDIDNLYSLPNNHISCFYRNESDIMWVGTSKLGVTYTSLHTITFATMRLPKLEDVSCLVEDEKGNLWLGFDGEGIAYYEKPGKKYSFFSKEEGTIPSNIIVCSLKDSKGKIWFGSYGNGVFYWQNGKFHTVNPSHEQRHFMNYIRCIEEDNEGNIWLGTIMDGIFCLDNTGEINSFYTMESSLLRTNSITTFSCTDGINLYIGTSSGLYCMDTQTKSIAYLESTGPALLSLDSIYVNCLYQDTRGLLWIGTRTGIYIYDVKTKELAALTSKDGLSNNYIRAIIEDKEKNIWLTTDNGITNIVVSNTVQKDSFRFYCFPYYKEDGIGDMVFNNHSVMITTNGEILMGGSGAFLRINPRHIKHIPNLHPVVFTNMYLANQRLQVGAKNSKGQTILEKNILLLNKITLDYSDSNFALEVSSMNYRNLHKLQYMYRLNENEEWVKLESNRIYFNELFPGKYKLEVKAHENSNIYKDNKITSLLIFVRPPWWRSTLAYTCYIFSIIVLIISLFRVIRKKHIRNLTRHTYEMQMAQQQEMNEAKMRFFTNVSHDLRTPLSLIIIPLEKLLTLDIEKTIREQLELIHRNTKILLNEINLLLDFRQLDQKKTQLNLSYGNLADFVRSVCNSFTPQIQEKDIQIQLVINSQDMNMDFDHPKMRRILFNLLSNAIKFNLQKGTITITLDKICLSGSDRVRIEVADTGIGIKNENKEKVFDRFYQEHQVKTTYVGSGIGLHIAKEYIEMHNGIIEVKDNHPTGTVFTIVLPITHDYIDHKQEEYEITPESLPVEEKQKKSTLLIVEDNNDFRQFLVNCLKDHYMVKEASNGNEALQILSVTPVEIVISDVMMPVMNGMELCRRIKTDIRYSHIPVILLTARTAEEHVVNGLKEGADEYITKPFNLDILLLRIQKILQWTENNHVRFKTMDISPQEITVSSLDERLIKKAIELVENNMDNPEFSVEKLSDDLGMSRGHLYKKLMSITGKSPIEFIHTLRIKRGKQLLEKSQDGISQIAYQIGLSPKQFAKYFKEEFGNSPSEYRKNKK